QLSYSNAKVYHHHKNQGKGAAVRTALQHATGDILIIQDADLEYDPYDYVELIKPIKSGHADVVYGSRLLGGKPQRTHLFWHKLGNSFLSLLTDFLYNTTLSDIMVGYKVFRKEVMADIKIKSNGFCFEPEITAKVLKQSKNRVYEVPISYYGRTFKEGKKINWLHGFPALFALIRYRFFD
ncbi:MAG: glycosyltransferase family 2 protein, partial [Candidatus Omnitrophota bacterium]